MAKIPIPEREIDRVSNVVLLAELTDISDTQQLANNFTAKYVFAPRKTSYIYMEWQAG